MHQQVIRFECDSCHKIIDEPLARGGLKRNHIPKDWMHVDGFSNNRTVFNLDLCEECKQPIAKIAEG